MKNTYPTQPSARAKGKTHRRYIAARFVSARVKQEIPQKVQNGMWLMLEMLPVEPDCLIAYWLFPEEGGVSITQKQHLPEYHRTIRMTIAVPSCAIYVVDEDDRYTMMFHEEFNEVW
ncbi:MAG: DUF960 domain-containing protein [Oscillospiraceae bacterium]|nr:DUF960 domain-containing protein [Oscillospiraceae bacterium]